MECESHAFQNSEIYIKGVLIGGLARDVSSDYATQLLPSLEARLMVCSMPQTVTAKVNTKYDLFALRSTPVIF